MSRVADLLIEQGRQAAAARAANGQVWGTAVQQLSQIPGQIQQQRRADNQFAIQQQREARLDAGAAQEQQIRGMQISDAQQASTAASLVGSIPRDASGNIDIEKVAALARQHDPGLVPHVTKLAQQLNTATGAYQLQQSQLDEHRQNRLGDVGLQLLQQPTDLGGFQLAVSTLTEKGLIAKADGERMLAASVEQPDFIAHQAHAWIQGSKEARATLAKPKVSSVDPTHDLIDESGKLIRAGVPAAATPAQVETARHDRELERVAGLTAGRTDAAQRETARHNKAMEQHADPFGGAGGPAGNDLLAKMPADQKAQSQALVDGRRSLDARLASTPYGRTIIAGAYAIDPTFDQGNYNARNKARTDLTSPNGTGGKTIGALNTAIQHAGKLSDLIEKLDNFESPSVNALINPVKTAFGSTKVTNYDTVAPQLAKEIERVWRGAGGTAGEIHDLIETIGHNKGKQQQREALQQFVDLAKGKLDSLEQQRDAVMGPAAGASIPILFKANQPIIDTIAQRASGKPAVAQDPITVTDPRNVVHTFPTQAAADAFKKAAGIR